MQRYLLQAMLIAGLVGSAAFAAPAADGQVYVRIGPPRARFERRPPPPAAGYAWRNGYNRWDGNRYVWTPGEYLAPPRPNARWTQGRWTRGSRGYAWRDGYWR